MDRKVCPTATTSLHLIDGDLHVAGLVVELSPDVYVRCPGTHGRASNKTAFHQLVWVVTHNLPVFARAGLTFISIHHQELGATIRTDPRYGWVQRAFIGN